VCSLPWTPAEPCSGYSQSYFGSPINPPFSRSSCEVGRPEESKCYYGNGAGSRDGCLGLKREERTRDSSSLDLGMTAGMGGGAAGFPKYDYGGEQIAQDPPSCHSLESDSSSSLLNEGSKASSGDAQTLASPGTHGGALAAGGGGCCAVLSSSPASQIIVTAATPSLVSVYCA